MNLYPPPDNIYLADAQPGTLVFNWTPVIFNCSTLQYSIASDCGACPSVTNMTSAMCSDLQMTTNAVVCHFRVSSRACGLVGNPSSPTAVTLKGTLIERGKAHCAFNKPSPPSGLCLLLKRGGGYFGRTDTVASISHKTFRLYACLHFFISSQCSPS